MVFSPNETFLRSVAGDAKSHPASRWPITTWEIVGDSSDRADYNGGRMSPSATRSGPSRGGNCVTVLYPELSDARTQIRHNTVEHCRGGGSARRAGREIG